MAITISLYDHSAKKLVDGSFSTSDTYKVMLCSSATFSAANTTVASITKTELSNGNGYTTGGATLSGVTVTQTGNDAAFDANDTSWSASGGTIGPAAAAIIYNDTDANDPPLAFIDFGVNQSAGDGTQFLLSWNASGIVTFTVS